MTYEELWRSLTDVYDLGEAKAVARYLLEARYGFSLADIACGAVEQLPEDELREAVERLAKAEPVQYVTGSAQFCGRTFRVAPGVLIPRPETEELCRWVLSDEAERQPLPHPTRILDIGTGSGCIAITLALGINGSRATAWDVSEEALAIARENVQQLRADVLFEQRDMLSEAALAVGKGSFDIVVSNPPYICEQERAGMERNVLDHEPPLALFVPDEDPLLFYRAIVRTAANSLSPGGRLYLEINPLYAEQLAETVRRAGFGHVELRRDQFDKTRFIKACL